MASEGKPRSRTQDAEVWKCVSKLPSLVNAGIWPVPNENFDLSTFQKKLVPYDGNHVL